MAGHHADQWRILARRFDKPVESGGKGVPKITFHAANGINAKGGIPRLDIKSVSKEQHTSGCKVCFGFNMFMTMLRQGRAVIAEHHPGVPWEERMTDLMRFVPPVLKDREGCIEQDALLIRYVEGFERKRFDCLFEERRALEDLDGCNADAANRLARDARIVSGVEAHIEFQEFADLLKFKWGLRVSEPPQDAFDPLIDVSCGFSREKAITGQRLLLTWVSRSAQPHRPQAQHAARH